MNTPRFAALVVAAFFSCNWVHAVTIDMIPVGNPGGIKGAVEVGNLGRLHPLDQQFGDALQLVENRAPAGLSRVRRQGWPNVHIIQ